MSYLIQPDYVRYACSCGKNKAITHLYFCRHCLKIRCGYCICHEVDSHYCGNCLENMPSSEARLKKNRCTSCFDCPSCFHILSTRAVNAAKSRPEGDDANEPKQTKKVYYLICFNCCWTSRDVGIPDQPIASAGLPERLNVYSQRFNALLEYYKGITQKEKQEKLERERKKFTIRGKYHTMTDKIGLTGAMARNIAGMGESGPSSMSPPQFQPSQAKEVVDDLPDDIYTKEVDLKQITSMAQRLAVPEWQPVTVDRLHPIPKLLIVKRSQRCRSCDHNLTKPEYNPGSVKFKIELLAYYHIPEIRIISIEPLKSGSNVAFLLKFTNPTGYETKFRLLPLKSKEENVSAEQSEDKDNNSTKTAQSIGDTEPRDEPKQFLDWSKTDVMISNATLKCPDVLLTLAQRDDAAEYDEDTGSFNENPELVLWKKSNKMALRLSALVDEGLPEGAPVNVGFRVQYSYMNTVPPSASNQSRQPKEHLLTVTVHVNLGSVIN